MLVAPYYPEETVYFENSIPLLSSIREDYLLGR